MDDSTEDSTGLIDTEVMEGDFVVVKVAGKSRVLNFIVIVDVVDDLEYEGVFLRKVPTGTSDRPTFVLNTKDIASFQTEDIRPNSQILQLLVALPVLRANSHFRVQLTNGILIKTLCNTISCQ